MLKLRVFDLYQKFSLTVLGPFYRSLGRKLYQMGANLQGNLYSDDRC